MAVLLPCRHDQQPRESTMNSWLEGEQYCSYGNVYLAPVTQRAKDDRMAGRAQWCCQVHGGELTWLKLWFGLCPGAAMWIMMGELGHFISDLWNNWRLWVLPQFMGSVRDKNMACRHAPQKLFWTSNGQGEPSWLAMLCVCGPMQQMPSLTPWGEASQGSVDWSLPESFPILFLWMQGDSVLPLLCNTCQWLV